MASPPDSSGHIVTNPPRNQISEDATSVSSSPERRRRASCTRLPSRHRAEPRGRCFLQLPEPQSLSNTELLRLAVPSYAKPRSHPRLRPFGHHEAFPLRESAAVPC